MKPQPPVTRIRTATASSAEAGALADFPILGPQFETWKNALAESEWTPWLIIGLAAFLRFFLLGIKPPHFDEGINGWFVDQLVKNGFYNYDRTNYLGPLHFYVLLLSQTLFGRNLWAQRPKISSEECLRKQEHVKMQRPEIIRPIVVVEPVLDQLIDKPAIDPFIEVRRFYSEQEKPQKRGEANDEPRRPFAFRER